MSCPDPAGGPLSREPAAGTGNMTPDAFLGGRFHLLQPPRGGFRSGLDALLLAACVPDGAGGRAADLGAGAGAVAFAAAVRAPALSVTMVERDETAAGLARASAALPHNAALASRLCVIEADIVAPRPAREAAGLFDGAFDFVLTNPPFHPFGFRTSPDPARRSATAIPRRDFLSRWIAVAAALLRQNGRFFMIGRPDNLADVFGAVENRLGGMCILPIQPRPNHPASRVLVAAVRGSRAPVRLLPAAILADASGQGGALAAGIANGTHHFAALFKR